MPGEPQPQPQPQPQPGHPGMPASCAPARASPCHPRCRVNPPGHGSHGLGPKGRRNQNHDPMSAGEPAPPPGLRRQQRPACTPRLTAFVWMMSYRVWIDAWPVPRRHGARRRTIRELLDMTGQDRGWRACARHDEGAAIGHRPCDPAFRLSYPMSGEDYASTPSVTRPGPRRCRRRATRPGPIRSHKSMRRPCDSGPLNLTSWNNTHPAKP